MHVWPAVCVEQLIELLASYSSSCSSFLMFYASASAAAAVGRQAELLLRSEELRDALWGICDSKHEEAEAARLKLAGDGSAAEHIGLLGLHLTSLAQVELDRWAATYASGVARAS